MGILILRIWGIHIVSLDELIKSGYTLLLLGVIIVILIVVYASFLKKNSSSYNKQVGKNAHPKL